jgi:hypothetical protein
MKKLKIFFTFLIIVSYTMNLVSQTIPETFNYQAVARDHQGLPIANQDIVIEISILQGNDCELGSTCNNLWQELHYPTTNEFGLFNVEIGSGQSTYSGTEISYSNINWNDVTTGNYFLKVRVDFGGALFGNGLIDMGVTEFLSVPYSLASESTIDVMRVNGKLPFGLSDLADVNIATPSNTEVLKWNGTEWINGIGGTGGATILDELDDVIITGTPTTNQTLLFNGTEWANQALNLNLIGGVNILGTPTVNQVLIFNGTEWTNSALSLNNLSNVNITGLADNDVLTWDNINSEWINSVASGGSSHWTQMGSDIYYNLGRVGVGTTIPNALFHVNTTADNHFLVTGELNTSTSIQNLGAGNRMVFFPVNASFRAGYVNGVQWNDVNTGDYSAAFGYNNIAIGANSFAAGSTNTAGGSTSVSFGTSNISSGARSFTMGISNTAGGDNSVAFGESCQTIGSINSQGSLACGFGTQTSGYFTSSWGVETSAREYAMMAIGHYNLTEGTGSQSSWIGGVQPVFVIGNGNSTTSADAFIVYQNGDATLAGTLTSASDKNLKENILTIENPIENLNKLRGVTYTWKEDVPMSKSDNNFHYGFIAQEVEDVFPSIVKTDLNNLKSVAYQEFIPLFLEAIKEQQKQIEELKSENEKLKSENQINSDKIDDLIIRIDQLDKKVSE